MYCSKCGNLVPSGSKFCPNCGEVLNNGQNVSNNELNVNNQMNNSSVMNTPPKNNTPNNKKKILIIVLCIIGVIILFIVGYNVGKQIRLHIVDKKVEEKAKELGEGEDINVPSKSEEKTKSYNVGDAVKLVDGSSWHVIRQDSNGQIVLLSDTLSKENSYYGADGSKTSQKYANSIVKQHLENEYLPALKQSLSNNGGDITNLTVRLITADEYLNLLGEEMDPNFDYRYSNRNYNIEVDTKKMNGIMTLTTSFWTMTNIEDYNPNSRYYGAYAIIIKENISMISFDAAAQTDVLNPMAGKMYGIRPVIETTIKNIK